MEVWWRGIEMKSFEIRKVVVGSVFKLYFMFGIVFGLIAIIAIILASASLKNAGIELGTYNLADGPFQVVTIAVGIIFGSLAYGLLTGLAGVIGALIYNAFAAMVGGVIIKLGDKD